jgi:hypothetical protein
MGRVTEMGVFIYDDMTSVLRYQSSIHPFGSLARKNLRGGFESFYCVVR